MMNPKRPRVAAIGLDDSQVESIEPLCGELRPADSLDTYLYGQEYSWTETDVMVRAVSWGRKSTVASISCQSHLFCLAQILLP